MPVPPVVLGSTCAKLQQSPHFCVGTAAQPHKLLLPIKHLCSHDQLMPPRVTPPGGDLEGSGGQVGQESEQQIPPLTLVAF